MEKGSLPLLILLVVLTVPLGFLIGATVAGLLSVGAGQGLAAGAMVLGYALVGAVVSAVLAVVIGRRMSKRSLLYGIVVVLVLNGLLVALTYHRVEQRRGERENSADILRPSGHLLAMAETTAAPLEKTASDGLGIFRPNMTDGKLLLYAAPNHARAATDHPAVDSITFGPLEQGGFGITSAPLNFVPHYMKLDCDILLLKVVSVSSEFAEVEVNAQTGQTLHVTRSSGQFQFWPDFLLTVFAIEFAEGKEQPVRVKPLGHASASTVIFITMMPIAAKDEWMQVRLMDDVHKEIGLGWIRYRDCAELLVRYVMMS